MIASRSRWLLSHRGEARDQRGEIGMFAGLHQAEMPLRQSQLRLARHARRARECRARRSRRRPCARCRSLATRLRMTPAMRTAGSCAAKPRTTAAADCACRDTSSTSTTGRWKCAARSAVAPRRPDAPACAVEQAHHAFDDENLGAVRGLRRQGIEQRARHRPAIEIDARRAGGGGMKRRVDVIRSGFRRAHLRCRAGSARRARRASPWFCRRRNAARR